MRIVTKVSLSVLVLSVLSTIIGGMVAYTSFTNLRTEMFKWFDKSSNTLAASIGERSMEYIYYFDYDSIMNILQSEAEADENLLYTSVRFGDDLDESKEFGDPEAAPFREYSYDHIVDGETLAKVTTHYSSRVVEEKLANLLRMLALGTLLTLALLVGSLYGLIVFLVNRPLKRLIDHTSQISGGDLSVSVSTGTEDEFGQLGDMFNNMTSSLRDMVESIRTTFGGMEKVSTDIARVAADLSSGSEKQAGAVGNVSTSVEEMNATIKTVAKNVEVMSETAEENSSSVLEISASIDEVAKNAESLSSSVEQTSSSINEMNASIQGVARSVEELSSIISEVTSSITETDQSIKEVERRADEAFKVSEEVSQSVASEGIRSVAEAVNGIMKIKDIVNTAATVITSLAEKTVDIGQIISIINDVNDQTSLLALNAAIIAAQAGEQGKAFSVVANEIRELSDKTASSTKEIANLIFSLQSESRNAVEVVERGSETVEKGVSLIQEVNSTLEVVRKKTEKSSDESRAIAQTTAEQARAIKQVMEMAQNMSEMFQKISDASREQSLGSEQIIQASENMRNLSEHVMKATAEQTKGMANIGKASENAQDLAKGIQNATEEEARGSELILQNIQEIQNISDSNIKVVKELDRMVHTLSGQAGQLSSEIDRFNTGEDQETPPDPKS